jgi:hypothetical protein
MIIPTNLLTTVSQCGSLNVHFIARRSTDSKSLRTAGKDYKLSLLQVVLSNILGTDRRIISQLALKDCSVKMWTAVHHLINVQLSTASLLSHTQRTVPEHHRFVFFPYWKILSFPNTYRGACKIMFNMRSDNKVRELTTMCLPWQQLTETSVWFDDVGISYQCHTAVLLIYGSLFLSGIYYCPSVFWGCCHENVGASIRATNKHQVSC